MLPTVLCASVSVPLLVIPPPEADAAAKAKLLKRVGKSATVMGDVEGMTVTVASVTTPKKIRKH